MLQCTALGCITEIKAAKKLTSQRGTVRKPPHKEDLWEVNPFKKVNATAMPSVFLSEKGLKKTNLSVETAVSKAEKVAPKECQYYTAETKEAQVSEIH